MSSTIAVVFDFDETLAHDSTSGYIESMGIDPAMFWGDIVNPLIDEHGWDQIPAYLYRMVELSQMRVGDDRITRDSLAAYGASIPLFSGVQRMFAELRKAAADIDDNINVEFYLISSGIGEIVRNTKIAREFKAIFACEFLYDDDDGGIVFPKNIISFTEKTRYLFQISKGMVGDDARTNAEAVNRKVERFSIPFRNMIFVGDGQTDIPCFQIIRREGGLAMAVFDPKRPLKWGKSVNLVEEDRVHMLCTTDYGKNGTIRNVLSMWVQKLARGIASGEAAAAPH